MKNLKRKGAALLLAGAIVGGGLVGMPGVADARHGSAGCLPGYHKVQTWAGYKCVRDPYVGVW